MILVTGGARSGKSRHAEALIGDSSQVLYIATSQILDDEMAARIEHHRQGRPAHWRTVERWQHLDELIHADINPHETVLLECVTTMVTNLLFDYGGDKDPDEWDYQAMEQAINAEIQSLIAACQRCPAKVVLVTNEVGMGIVPESRLARHFRDIAGYAWCGCYGGDDGGDFHPRSASQTYAGRANRRYAGSCYRAW